MQYDVCFIDFQKLLSQSDIVSIHAPFTSETQGIFNRDAFRKMKDDAMIINISRGGLINEPDLIEALRQGDIRFAGLDVFEKEPLPEDSPLKKMDNVLLTCHSAFYGDTAQATQLSLAYNFGHERIAEARTGHTIHCQQKGDQHPAGISNQGIGGEKMANIGCRIYPEFERPRVEWVEAFRGMPVANIDDCMNRTAAMRPEIRRLGTSDETMLGTAFTVKVAEGDNLMFHKAMDMAQPGDVIVIDAGGAIERSILGALMANYCKARGVRGIIVDGSVRDCAELASMKDFAVYAKAVSPNGPYKNGPGELRGVISVGGIVVHPGDIKGNARNRPPEQASGGMEGDWWHG